jgi:hypothetical protein
MTSLDRKARALATLLTEIVIGLGTSACSPPRPLPEPEPEAREPDAPVPERTAPDRPPQSHVEKRPERVAVGGPCEAGVREHRRVGPDMANMVHGLATKTPLDYVELVLFEGGGSATPLMASGTKCASAKDWRTCESEADHAALPPHRGFHEGCIPGFCAHALVVTSGDDVRVLAGPEEVAELLGPIDTPTEAMLLAFANGYWPGGEYYPTCAVLKGDAIKPTAGGGYQLKAKKVLSSCPMTDATVMIQVGAKGELKEMARLSVHKSNACAGRRPPRYRARPVVRPPGTDPVASYLIELAGLEAASIGAFEVLALEVEREGAPAGLVRACQRARRDEIRHARRAATLARRYGAARLGSRPSATRPRAEATRRSLAVLARENEIEGCEREAFGALSATYQAHHATDPAVAAFFRGIAEDETRHFALALELRAFYAARLSAAEQRRVARARTRALARLREGLASEVPERLATLAGVPRRDVALALLDRLRNLVEPPPA